MSDEKAEKEKNTMRFIFYIKLLSVSWVGPISKIFQVN